MEFLCNFSTVVIFFLTALGKFYDGRPDSISTSRPSSVCLTVSDTNRDAFHCLGFLVFLHVYETKKALQFQWLNALVLHYLTTDSKHRVQEWRTLSVIQLN